MSRNTKCTPTLTEAIAQKVKLMGAIGPAAILCGVAADTARGWYRLGKKGKKYSAFHIAIEKALTEWEQSRIVNITKAEQEGTWQASAWKLERNPHTRERYRPPTQKTDNINKNLNHNIVVVWADGTDEDNTPEVTSETANNKG